jgi:hypothetical protein
MTSDKDKLFGEFLVEFDPLGEICPWISESQLQEHFRHWQLQRSYKSNTHTNDQYSKREDPKQNKTEEKDKSHVIVECGICNTRIRLTYPFVSKQFRCRRCSAGYKIIPAQGAANVYVIQLITATNHEPSRENEKKTVPAEIRNAFEVLGLKGDNIDFQTLKKQYRLKIHEYHPDKVAGLGVDLRHLAEERTKAFVAAYEIAKAFFERIERR